MTLIRFTIALTAASILLAQTPPAPTQGLPEGEGKDLTQQVCSTCHEITLVTAERHSEPQWKAIVDDMVRRGADASDSDKKAILAYLVKNFGK